MNAMTPNRREDDPATDSDQHKSFGSALRVESERLPSSPLIRFLRWWLPAIICLVGIGIAVVNRFDDASLEALSLFVGAGSSLWLMNFLWRLGISGDEDREREEAARRYLEKYGHWPEDRPTRR